MHNWVAYVRSTCISDKVEIGRINFNVIDPAGLARDIENDLRNRGISVWRVYVELPPSNYNPRVDYSVSTVLLNDQYVH